MKKIILSSIVFIVGVLVGGYLFRDTQARSFLAFDECQSRCFDRNELLGLLGSVGVQQTTGLIPNVVAETDTVVAFKHPFPDYKTHYIIVPKRDIRDAANLSEEDRQTLADVYAVVGDLVRKDNLKAYRVITNGPGYQEVTYLHFHLISNEKNMK